MEATPFVCFQTHPQRMLPSRRSKRAGAAELSVRGREAPNTKHHASVECPPLPASLLVEQDAIRHRKSFNDASTLEVQYEYMSCIMYQLVVTVVLPAGKQRQARQIALTPTSFLFLAFGCLEGTARSTLAFAAQSAEHRVRKSGSLAVGPMCQNKRASECRSCWLTLFLAPASPCCSALRLPPSATGPTGPVLSIYM